MTFQERIFLECLGRSLGKINHLLYFRRTHAGAKLDLFRQQGGQNWGVEFKYADAPRLTKSMTSALNNLELVHLWGIYPGKTTYRLAGNITVCPLRSISAAWEYGV